MNRTEVALRVIDVVLAAVGLVLTSPLLAAVTVVGFLDTGSPYYRQERVGRWQEPFTLVKFRTMKVGTASVASHMADTAAITPLGRILRSTKLDELPQLINVLRGEMSLVGPRPCLPSQTELLQVRDRYGVFSVRPGITGLAQVNDIDMSTPELLARTDAEMIEAMSVRHYLSLLRQTISGEGRGDASMK